MKERNNIVVFKRALIFTTIAIFFFLLGTTRHFYSQGQKDSSFSKAHIFKKHILSLDYISRKTASSKFFLKMAKKYWVSGSKKQIEEIFAAEMLENVKKGWNKV